MPVLGHQYRHVSPSKLECIWLPTRQNLRPGWGAFNRRFQVEESWYLCGLLKDMALLSVFQSLESLMRSLRCESLNGLLALTPYPGRVLSVGWRDGLIRAAGSMNSVTYIRRTSTSICSPDTNEFTSSLSFPSSESDVSESLPRRSGCLLSVILVFALVFSLLFVWVLAVN